MIFASYKQKFKFGDYQLYVTITSYKWTMLVKRGNLKL